MSQICNLGYDEDGHLCCSNVSKNAYTHYLLPWVKHLRIHLISKGMYIHRNSQPQSIIIVAILTCAEIEQGVEV